MTRYAIRVPVSGGSKMPPFYLVNEHQHVSNPAEALTFEFMSTAILHAYDLGILSYEVVPVDIPALPLEVVEPIKCEDRYENAECKILLRLIREAAEKATRLKRRLDRGGVVGTLWGVCNGLDAALSAAESALLPPSEE